MLKVVGVLEWIVREGYERMETWTTWEEVSADDEVS